MKPGLLSLHEDSLISIPEVKEAAIGAALGTVGRFLGNVASRAGSAMRAAPGSGVVRTMTAPIRGAANMVGGRANPKLLNSSSMLDRVRGMSGHQMGMAGAALGAAKGIIDPGEEVDPNTGEVKQKSRIGGALRGGAGGYLTGAALARPIKAVTNVAQRAGGAVQGAWQDAQPKAASVAKLLPF